MGKSAKSVCKRINNVSANIFVKKKWTSIFNIINFQDSAKSFENGSKAVVLNAGRFTSQS